MTQLANQLKNLGFVYDVFAGFQFDLNTALKKSQTGYEEGHLCDHNCSLDCGNYSCPAAFSKNKGADPRSLLSLEEIISCLKNAKAGLELMNRQYLEEHFDTYVEKFKISEEVAKELKNTLKNGQVELNMFGGNPELHPDFLQIIKEAHKIGWRVTTTTTGKKFMHDEKFVEGFLSHPPDLLAISADDYDSIDELNEILEMDAPTIKKYWQKANPLYGQRKKAYESMYVAKLAQDDSRFPKVLFNIVVHPGNLDCIDQMLDIFKRKYPEAIVNPYPAQSSFDHSPVVWQAEQLPQLEKFVDNMIQAQLEQAETKNKSYVPRLPYWMALKSVFNSFQDKDKVAQYISGNKTWQCFREPGAGRYIQASSSDTSCQAGDRVGGHPGCFWNRSTVTLIDQHLWLMTPEEVADYLLNQKPKLPAQSKKPCPGCIMPRLMFDGPVIEQGLAPELIPEYLKLRKQYLLF